MSLVMNQLIRCLIVVLILSCLCFAQESASKTKPSASAQKPETELQRSNSAQVVNPSVALPVIFGPIEKIELSPEANSWAVQILSRGGITGSGRGDLTITSQGDLLWNAVGNQCNAKLVDDVLRTLTQTVFSANAPGWGRTTSGFCADCYLYAISLQRRESDGVESTYIASWDDTSAASIPADLREVYDTFMTYKGCKQ
jgi:hypothetical protein